MVVDAFRAEAERLSETVSGIDEACFVRDFELVSCT
jgi:hypothetical protein